MSTNQDSHPIILENYCPLYADKYRNEEKLLREVFVDADIQHIGSTSISGMSGRPEIDIQLSVPELEKPSTYDEQLKRLGYQHKVDDFDQGQLFYCKKDSDGQIYHLHIVQAGSPEQERQIVFRDYLRGNPRGAQEYEALKRAMAEKFRDDRSAYVDAKTAFITLALCMYAPQNSTLEN